MIKSLRTKRQIKESLFINRKSYGLKDNWRDLKTKKKMSFLVLAKHGLNSKLDLRPNLVSNWERKTVEKKGRRRRKKR